LPATDLRGLHLPRTQRSAVYFKKEVKQYSEMNYEELGRYIRDLQQSGFDVVRLRVQLNKKLSFPMITLIMPCSPSRFHFRQPRKAPSLASRLRWESLWSIRWYRGC